MRIRFSHYSGLNDMHICNNVCVLLFFAYAYMIKKTCFLNFKLYFSYNKWTRSKTELVKPTQRHASI